jgi:metal-responsive CopG/Arc/MetJ family transcriptional regulator
MARLNITLPDELAARLQGLAEEKKIASVSGFLAESARLKLVDRLVDRGRNVA